MMATSSMRDRTLRLLQSTLHLRSSLFWTARAISTTPPLSMGRRSAKIATRKGSQDAVKAKLWCKIAKQVIQATKQGGSNPDTHARLKEVLHTAKQIGMPKDIISRNMKKATDKDQKDFSEVVYEAYGLGSCGFVIESFTDNTRRALTEVRDAVIKNGGKMAEKGSVIFNFTRSAQIAVPEPNIEEKLFQVATAAGASEILSDEDANGVTQGFKVVGAMEDYNSMKASLLEAGISVNEQDSGLVYLPHEWKQVSEEELAGNNEIVMKLLAKDDVDRVFTNCAELQN